MHILLGQLAKAKVAGSNPVFRSKIQAGFTAISALGPASLLRESAAGRSRVESGSTFAAGSFVSAARMSSTSKWA
jgi:hypothetical protein